MTNNDIKTIKLEELKTIQKNFEESIKVLEKNIAENVTNKLKLEEIKKDLREANKKFTDAERCLDDLKIELDNNQHALDARD
jgi:plasmid rolling circle replication initiator protein Rep